jgi:uncharacterized protein YifE (UPF0438 family)
MADDLKEVTKEERSLIIKHHKFYQSLETGQRSPTTIEQKHFVDVCRGYAQPKTEHEILYSKFIVHRLTKMPYVLKKIICLAKSRKTGGFCVAGKEILSDGSFGQWLRPVSSRPNEEISANDCRFENGHLPNLLDIIEVPLKQHHPNCFQWENYLIDYDYYWSKEGVYDSDQLSIICDDPDDLWGAKNSSYYGLKDRVQECYMNDLENSLYLITPAHLAIEVRTEGAEFGNPIRKVRANFEYNGISYIFPITDPSMENQYLAQEDGQYSVENSENRVFMCVSIGLPYENYCYKFVASLIGL